MNANIRTAIRRLNEFRAMGGNTPAQNFIREKIAESRRAEAQERARAAVLSIMDTMPDTAYWRIRRSYENEARS